jgi:hypothetical protein
MAAAQQLSPWRSSNKVRATAIIIVMDERHQSELLLLLRVQMLQTT